MMESMTSIQTDQEIVLEIPDEIVQMREEKIDLKTDTEIVLGTEFETDPEKRKEIDLETEIDLEKRKEIDLETEIDPGRKEEKDPEIDREKGVEADQENVEKTMINTRAQNINVHHIVPGLYCKLQITCIWLFQNGFVEIMSKQTLESY